MFVDCIDLDRLPAVLRDIPPQWQSQLTDSLLNDQVSSNQELITFWTTDCCIAKDVAEAAIEFRNEIMTTPCLHLFDPANYLM